MEVISDMVLRLWNEVSTSVDNSIVEGGKEVEVSGDEGTL